MFSKICCQVARALLCVCRGVLIGCGLAVRLQGCSDWLWFCYVVARSLLDGCRYVLIAVVLL